MESFKKYNSIINFKKSALKEDSELGKLLLESSECVVTEKIHGANFSVLLYAKYINETEYTVETKLAKRNQILEENEDFYNSDLIFQKYKECFINVFYHLVGENIINPRDHTSASSAISVFGEIFGGGYGKESILKQRIKKESIREINNSKVLSLLPKSNELTESETALEIQKIRQQLQRDGQWERYTEPKLVQQEVFYCDDNEFMAFDIHVNAKTNFYLDFKIFESICIKSNIPYIKPLMIASINNILQYLVGGKSEFEYFAGIDFREGFITSIPKYFGLDNIPENIAEGIVIKPLHDVYFENGGRVVFKIKNKKFVERHGKPIKSVAVGVDVLQKLISLYPNYINNNRMQSAISKVGDNLTNDYDIILEMFRDVCADMENDYTDDFKLMSKNTRKKLTDLIFADCKKIVSSREL